MSTEERLKKDPVFGVDSRRSWVTAAFCSALFFLTLSTISVSGVFFYGIVEAFGVSREQASWPVTLSGSMLPLACPLTGLLCSRFSCRKVLLVCSFLTGIAVSMCYFAESTLFIVVFFGIINGYFRDRHGSYSGLLHSTAIVNGLMVVVWIIKLLNGRKQLLPTKAVQYSKEIRKEIGTELLELGRTAASDAGQ
ncbi:uncharacterized protein [Dermacentor andersoni]|uniref:uncharacterized protein isoform X2 n=1 Tax=Dermacentor andersoni TaxID=34620 RepID=UPI003B3B8A36